MITITLNITFCTGKVIDNFNEMQNLHLINLILQLFFFPMTKPKVADPKLELSYHL